MTDRSAERVIRNICASTTITSVATGRAIAASRSPKPMPPCITASDGSQPSCTANTQRQHIAHEEFGHRDRHQRQHADEPIENPALAHGRQQAQADRQRYGNQRRKGRQYQCVAEPRQYLRTRPSARSSERCRSRRAERRRASADTVTTPADRVPSATRMLCRASGVASWPSSAEATSPGSRLVPKNSNADTANSVSRPSAARSAEQSGHGKLKTATTLFRRSAGPSCRIWRTGANPSHAGNRLRCDP